MKNKGKYNVSGLKEAQFEPRSGDKVLQNLQGVTDPEDMDIMEANALAGAMNNILHTGRGTNL